MSEQSLEAAQRQAALAQELRDAQKWRRGVHRQWAPELAYGRHDCASRSAREAAVLALIYPDGDQWIVPAIVRPGHMAAHAGQVALPGGVTEAGETAAECAVREYVEELGASPTGIEIVGELSRIFVFNSNFVITPIVAMAKERPGFIPSADEVAEVLEISGLRPLEVGAQQPYYLRRRGLVFSSPSFNASNVTVWGATCMILAELAGCLYRAGFQAK